MFSKSILSFVLVLGMCWANEAAAQTISPEKIAQGQKLYDEAVPWMDKGQFAEACPKLEEAVRLVPEGVGAKLELAKCYEGAGRYASAWRAYKIAEAATALAGQQERNARAHERAAAIEAKLSTLTIAVSPAVRQLPGFKLTRNGTVVDTTDLDTPIPVDGGSYLIEATATGKERWQKVVEIGPTESRARVVVGSLENAVAAGVSAQPSRGWQGAAGLAIGSVGVAGLVIGGIVGGAAISKYDESKAPGRCDAQNQCDQTGLDLRNSALSMANASTGLVIAGGVLLAGGIVLFATAPKTTSTQEANTAPRYGANVQLDVGPSGLRIRGTW